MYTFRMSVLMSVSAAPIRRREGPGGSDLCCTPSTRTGPGPQEMLDEVSDEGMNVRTSKRLKPSARGTEAALFSIPPLCPANSTPPPRLTLNLSSSQSRLPDLSPHRKSFGTLPKFPRTPHCQSQCPGYTVMSAEFNATSPEPGAEPDGASWC